jgi:hypothetical protein
MRQKKLYGDYAKKAIAELTEQNSIPTLLEYLSNVIADRACDSDCSICKTPKERFDMFWDVASRLAKLSDGIRKDYEFRV